jgi:hypothetical protein
MFPLEKPPLERLSNPVQIVRRQRQAFVLFHLPGAIGAGKTTRLGADISPLQVYIGSAIPTSHPFGLIVAIHANLRVPILIPQYVLAPEKRGG